MSQATLAQFTNPVEVYHNKLNNGSIHNQHSKIFFLLADNAPHYAKEMALFSPQYNARIYELRRGNNKLYGTGLICDIHNFRNKGGEPYFIMLGYRQNEI